MPHIHDKIDFTVEVFVVYKDRVLLRKHDKYKLWLSVGGHIELDEDPNEAAIREVREETGLDIRLIGNIPNFSYVEAYREIMAPRFMNRHSINDNHEHVTMVYFAVASDDRIIQSQNELSDDIKWFSLEDLDDESYIIRESVKYCAKKALSELSV